MVINDVKVHCFDPLIKSYEDFEIFDPKMYPNCIFCNEGIEQITAIETYDLIFCINAINHVRDLNKSWSSLFAAAKKGSTLIFSIDCHRHSFFKWLFRLVPVDVLHPHQYSLKEYSAMAQDAGLLPTKSLKMGGNFFFDYFVLICEKP